MWPMETDRLVERSLEALSAGTGPDQMRQSYLSLLKLALVDLLGVRTQTIHFTETGELFTRYMGDNEMQYRINGIDWPAHAMTMVGLARLDDLQTCVEQVVADQIPGDVIEAGTWRGGASILMRATLNSLGDTERTVWLADSFNGFPEPDREAYPEDRRIDFSDRDFIAVPEEQVRQHFARYGCAEGIEFVPGFFEETMPTMESGTWSLVRLDGDSYEATMITLSKLYPGLSKGGYLVIDDFGALPECSRAVEDYRKANGITEPIEQIDWTGARWRKADEANPAAGEAPTRSRQADRTVPRQTGAWIPTQDELNLRREVERLQALVDEK